MGEFIYTMKNVRKAIGDKVILDNVTTVSYTHLTLPTIAAECRSRWSPYH